ncbi:RpiR family transcriptional regulator [Entomoplasma freundtii]|uniref:Uncharacterized protein n=1 Tax=Entomoplasma freundtii TaxID=74700 RepID=A0A2K8NR11_9MOLU|nr:MurR/RpiR family transcriptional regulator [Entomoplasma freundtii]ATZ16280.1 hypothetical protein EFREU_v1c02530 [Entomoplasma freundtii]TDY56819.1 RpiR family transcriptional regulator [Entomoplasma freundtii]
MILDQLFEMTQSSEENLNHRLARVIIDELLINRQFKLTVTTLSQKANCSQPSVSRFAKSLTGQSYKHFVNLINEEAPSYFLIWNREKETIDDGKNKIIQAVVETLDYFKSEEIEAISRLIIRSNKINVVGIGGNRTIKTEVEHKLSQVGRHVMLSSDWHQQLINLNYMTSNDLVIIISYSGDKRESNQIANEANKRKIPLILFSGDFNSELINKAQHYVCIKSGDPKYRSFSFAAKPAVMAAWEIIFKYLLTLDIQSEEIVEAWSWKSAK